LNSGASVRYTVLDSNGKPVMGNNYFIDHVIEFDKVYPVPGENQYKPFKLVIEYKSERQEREQCPLLEIYFSLAPISFQ